MNSGENPGKIPNFQRNSIVGGNMRLLFARASLAAACFVCLTAIGAGQGDRPIDSVITQQPVQRFGDFERAVQIAASRCGISPEISEAILQQFAQKYSMRVAPYTEWRAFLLESLYSHEIPYPVARDFIRSLADRGLPVDNGFLDAVRVVDLEDKSVHEVGKVPGLIPPKAISRPLPPYPAEASAARVEGVVRLKCVVLEDGTVANCKVERPAGWGFDESALLTVQDKWKFEPARLEGAPVASRMGFEFSLRLY